jgi:hypothetical protein
MKEVMRIVFTNWINALTVYSCIFLALFIGDLIPGISTIKEALYNTFGSLIVHYLHFWLGFTLLIALLDVVLFSFNREPRYTNYKLALEWIIISLPFIYWLIKYNQWIFLLAILAFLIGQYLRRPYIFKILE